MTATLSERKDELMALAAGARTAHQAYVHVLSNFKENPHHHMVITARYVRDQAVSDLLTWNPDEDTPKCSPPTSP